MAGDGVDLSRLIVETRKLATENAQFCEIHSQQNEEINKLKNTAEATQVTNESLASQISQLKSDLSARINTENQLKHVERDLKKKIRDTSEENQIECDKRQNLEEKVKNLSEQRREFETRLKLTRSEVQNLRHQNTVLQSERDTLETRLRNMEESSARQKCHSKSLCLELDHLTSTREDASNQLTSTRLELSTTQDRLDTALGEIDLQKNLLTEIEKISNRLKAAEQQNANYETEITAMNGKIAAITNQYEDTLTLHERDCETKTQLEMNLRERKEEILRLSNLLQLEEESKLSDHQRLAAAQKSIQKLTGLLDQSQLERDQEASRHAFHEQKICAQLDEQNSQLLKTISEHEQTISSTEAELREILMLNQKKEQQLTDQFRKFEELITLNTKQEMTLLSLKNHSGEIERQFKNVNDEKNRLQSDLDRVNLENGRKATDITVLTDQLHLSEDKRIEFENELEELRITLGKASSQSRKAQNNVSQLTAEQARFTTELSQIKRKHQSNMNSKEDEYRNEKKRVQQEYESMISELDLLKTEWQTRAKNAECNLVKMVKKYDRHEKNVQSMQREIKEANNVKNVSELKRLKTIDKQQTQLIAQQKLLLEQWSLGERLKKFMRNTVLEFNKKNTAKCAKWSSSRNLLRFRRIALVIIACNRLKRRDVMEDDFVTASYAPSLCSQLRSGLQAILTKSDAIQLYSTKLLAGNVQEGIQAILDKNGKLEREKIFLRQKLKSSTSFMSELEQRVKSIESK